MQIIPYWPPNTKLSCNFIQASDDWVLMSAGVPYKVEIMDMRLLVQYVVLHPSIHASNLTRLLREPIELPINCTEIHTLPIGQGHSTVRWEVTKGGILPKKLLFTFLASDAFNGSILKNPFWFRPFNLNYLQLKVNSDSYPFEPYTPNFDQKLVMREYRALFDQVCT